MSAEHPVLWTPSPERIERSRMAAFLRWLEAERGLTFDDYQALWDWSVTDLDGFWSAIWSFCDIPASVKPTTYLAERKLPGAVWCPEARLNFAQVLLKTAQDQPDEPALIVRSETFGRKVLTWAELSAQVTSTAARFRALGVGKGDRVAAILPNTEAPIIAFLATASLGAIWSLCAPDMGHVAILDRFKQIEPKLIVLQDGYVHGGKTIDRRDVLATILDGLPTLQHKVMLPVVGDLPDGMIAWDEVIGDDISPDAIDVEQVEFDHPLWIVYSSGTTGNPKPIVHGHGGIALECCKQALHQDLTADDRFC